MQEIRARHRPGVVVWLAALALACVAAASASPALASGAHRVTSDWTCGLVESPDFGLFSGLTGPASAGSARGDGQLREPDLGQLAVEAPRSARARTTGSEIVVPTYVHVVTPDGVTGNVSSHKIQEQIKVLDLTFGGFYGGAELPFDFELAGVTRTVNADWYFAGPSTREEQAMKRALHAGGSNALNLYLTTAGAYLGWAYFPSIVEGQQAYLDGVVIDWESLPNVSDAYEDRYDLGYTATHEVGHWLNLYHTFDGACGALGDRVDDTPAELTATSGCPAGKDTCRMRPGADPIHNYMDYSYDACYTEFTAGQATRMLDAWNFWRAPAA
jgi:hypothetical protein